MRHTLTVHDVVTGNEAPIIDEKEFPPLGIIGAFFEDDAAGERPGLHAPRGKRFLHASIVR